MGNSAAEDETILVITPAPTAVDTGKNEEDEKEKDSPPLPVLEREASIPNIVPEPPTPAAASVTILRPQRASPTRRGTQAAGRRRAASSYSSGLMRRWKIRICRRRQYRTRACRHDGGA